MVINTDGYELTYKDGRVHQFYSSGKLWWLQDRNGNQTTVNYSGPGGTGIITGVTDSVGRTLSFILNSNGRVITARYGSDDIATYAYKSSSPSHLETVTYLDGSKYKFEYQYVSQTGHSLISSVKDYYDNILEKHEYDTSDRAFTSEKHNVQGLGPVEKYTLSYTTTYTQVTDGIGRVAKYYTNQATGFRVVTKVEGFCGCSGGDESTEYLYDGRLNLIKKTDAL